MNSSLYTQDDIRQYLNAGIWDLTSLKTNCEKNSRLYPDKEAVVDSKRRLTWVDVREESDRLAAGLLKIGLRRDDIIITQLYTCVEIYLLIVACQKAGVILATVTPNFREASLEPVLRHVKAKAAVIPWRFREHDFYAMYQAMRPHIPSLQQIIVIGDEVPEGAVSFQDLLKTVVTREDRDRLHRNGILPWELSRVGTTSGSTGIPKLYEVIESSRISTVRNIIDRWEITEKDIVGAFYPITGGGLEKIALTAAPMTGAKLVLSEHFSPKDFCEIVSREKVTIAALVPTEMVRILDYPDLDKYDMSSLRLFANSTDVLLYELGVRAEERFNCVYVNTYGATDTGGLCASSVRDSREVRLRTVGRPYDHAIIRIVDEEGNAVPTGEVGEIMAKRNPLSASGYFNNPELNEQLWGTGWFDLMETGKFDEEGNLTLVGRKRNVIKRGGRRISPKEIEDLIMLHPDVRVVAVVGMPDAEMGQKACAYIVPKPDKHIGMDEILSFLKDKNVTPFLLPERVEVIGQMPVLLTGQKIDRRWLEQDIANKLKQEAAAIK